MLGARSGAGDAPVLGVASRRIFAPGNGGTRRKGRSKEFSITLMLMSARAWESAEFPLFTKTIESALETTWTPSRAALSLSLSKRQSRLVVVRAAVLSGCRTSYRKVNANCCPSATSIPTIGATVRYGGDSGGLQFRTYNSLASIFLASVKRPLATAHRNNCQRSLRASMPCSSLANNRSAVSGAM